MPIDRNYYIHSRAGLLGADGVSTTQDIDRIIGALDRERAKHLIIHFHGGLVSAENGFRIAETLLPIYRPGGYPLFFVWESGAWETIRNNLGELADEPIFKQFLRKALEYALGKLGARSGARSISPGQVDAAKVRRTLDDFIADPRPEKVPYKDFVPATSEAETRSATDRVDEAEYQADLESDDDFKRALAGLPDVPEQTRSALLPPGDAELPVRTSRFAQLASEKLSQRPGQRGFVTLWKAALLLKDIVVGVLKRYRAKRDHGFYATVVEEIVRAFKLLGSAINEWGKALQWNRMKQDCRDAFGGDPTRHAGTALLSRLAAALKSGSSIDRITLVGHSTGAIYICEWLAAADRVLDPNVRFDVVLLAPAVTYARFAAAIEKQEARIANFRMFAMNDELERADQVWGDDPHIPGGQDWRRFVYPSSLLYLVSGILESKDNPDGDPVDEPDMPLLGMQRFFSTATVYDEQSFPDVAGVRAWLVRDQKRTVWSFSDNVGPGLNSHSNDHGYFDNEPNTLESLTHIMCNGF
jgi:hypothetical protein